MAESELITQVDSAYGWMTRCILLTPNAAHDEWLERLRSAVAQAGLELIFVQDQSQQPIAGEDNRVMVACDADFLEPSSDAHVTVILTDVSSALRQTERLTGAKLYDGVVDASKLLLKASTFPATWRYHDASSPGGSLEILPGIWVERPIAPSVDEPDPLELAAAEAFRIYECPGMVAGTRAILRAPLFEFDERQMVDPGDVNLDTLGGPRWLLRGPGISLPAGEWQFSATFSLNDEAAKHRYAFDCGDIDDLQRTEICTKSEGIFRVSVTCSWAKCVKADMRFVLCEGSMGGQFSFDFAEVLCLKRL